MFKKANLTDIFISFNIVSWLLLLFTNLYTLLDNDNNVVFGSAAYLRSLMLNLFLLFAFFYYQYRIFSDDYKNKNFVDLLFAILISGTIFILSSLAIRLSSFLIKRDSILPNLIQDDKVQLLTYFYHVQIGLIVIFITKIFTIWKRMILFQKSRGLQTFWNIFEYGLLGSLLLNFFYLEPLEIPFIIALSCFGLMIIVLSSNLRWVAYLSFRDKWKSILFILLIMVCCSYFIQLLFSYYYVDNDIHFTDLKYSIYVWVILGFIFIYAFFSVLVLIFNLPTSSVMEKKLGEMLNFQKLTQSLQVGQKENKMYELLLESATKTTVADAGWLEVRSEKGSVEFSLKNNLDNKSILQVTKVLRKNGSYKKKGVDIQLIQNIRKNLFGQGVEDQFSLPQPYKSVLEVPLYFQEKNLGNLVLLKQERDGFDKENIEIVNTFAQLASVAIENSRLVGKAIENERYQEALKIARRVQQKLLPDQLINNEFFEMSAFSQTAEEVGGDYYDLYEVNPDRTAIIIADVSGKGTQAAFYMAQMKGVFQSLAELDLSPDTFLQHTNTALSRSLEKSYFVTASFFLIDSGTRKIHFSRAGHCPTLYYHYDTKTAAYIKDKGFALGMFRQKEYINHIENREISYKKGDMLLLYTDGIVEAKDPDGEEYGYERLKEFLEIHAKATVHQFTNNLLDELHRFSGNKVLDDDYTIFLIRFN